jgi:hypothetical protein
VEQLQVVQCVSEEEVHIRLGMTAANMEIIKWSFLEFTVLIL